MSVHIATLPEHSPPAYLDDLTPDNKKLWSKNVISAYMAQEIQGGLPGPCGSTRSPLSQFFDGTVTAFDVDQTPVSNIQWIGFPNQVYHEPFSFFSSYFISV